MTFGSATPVPQLDTLDRQLTEVPRPPDALRESSAQIDVELDAPLVEYASASAVRHGARPVTHEDVTIPGRVDGPPGPDALARFDTASRAVGELFLALASAVSAVQFEDALRLRDQTGQALSYAADLAAIADRTERESAVRQLAAMQRVASRLFQIAPGASALAAMKAGDATALHREQQAWIAERLASGTRPRPRARRNTQPDSVRAWMVTHDADAIDESTGAVFVDLSAADEDSAQ